MKLAASILAAEIRAIKEMRPKRAKNPDSSVRRNRAFFEKVSYADYLSSQQS